MKLSTILSALMLAALLEGLCAKAASWGYNVTNNTLSGVDLAFYQSNAPGVYTFETNLFLGAGANAFLTNSANALATNGIALSFTNQNSFAGIGYLVKLPALIASGAGATATGCNVSSLFTNYFTQFAMPAYSSATPGVIGGGNESTSAPAVYYPATGGGYYAIVTHTVAVPNTNQLWVAGAGTTAANGEYVLQGPAFLNGQIFTNVDGLGDLCSQFGGALTGNEDQRPFWMGPATNNLSSLSTNNTTGPVAYWYFSSVAINAFWTTNGSYFAGTGISPYPTVNFGTNYTTVATPVYINATYYGAMFTNGIIFVSQTGNDALASNCLCAFATCRAAKGFAQAGDTIHVLPGTYEENDLLKNDVDWDFKKGATIAWDAPIYTNNTRGIFDDYAGAVTSTITGDRVHFSLIVPNPADGILETNPASNLTFTFNTADPECYDQSMSGNSLPFPGAQNPFANFDEFFCSDVNGGYLSLTVNKVCNFTNAPIRILDVNDGDVGASTSTYGQYIWATNGDLGFAWGGGEEHIHLGTFICTNYPGVSTTNGSGVATSVNGSILPYGFLSDNGGTTETHCFFNADKVNAFLYWEDSNPAARTWFNITFLQGPFAHNGAAAAQYNGAAGFNYYAGMKIVGFGVPPLAITGGGSSGQQRFWGNIQKLTQNGASCWFEDWSQDASVWLNVLNYEDASGGTMTGGIELGENGGFTGTNVLSGGNVVSYSNAHPVDQWGGNSVLEGMQIQAFGTNADIYMMSGTNNALTLQADILHSQTAAESIWSATNTWIYGNTNSSSCDVAPTNLVHFNGNPL